MAKQFYRDNGKNLSLDAVPFFYDYYWHEGDTIGLSLVQ